MLLFGSVAWGSGLSEHANFTAFPIALLTMFRLATGDNWSDVMLVGHAWRSAQIMPRLESLARGQILAVTLRAGSS